MDGQDGNFTIENFVELRQTVQQLQQSLNNLEMANGMRKRRDSILSDTDDDDIFPIETVEELNSFEQNLRENKETRKKLVYFHGHSNRFFFMYCKFSANVFLASIYVQNRRIVGANET